MNKKIIIPAIASIFLQISLLIIIWNRLFTEEIRWIGGLLITFFYIIAIPFTIYNLFKKEKEVIHYKNPLNVLGTFLTLPIILTSFFLYVASSELPPKEVEVEDVHLYTPEGREINTTNYDSFMKDTGNIDHVKIDELKKE